jgi:SAM-dependent methyltransferase
MTFNSDFYHEVTNCLSCGHPTLEVLIDLGKTTLAGYFPEIGRANDKFGIPFSLVRCLNCKLIQSSPNVSDDFLFSDYRYVSGFAMKLHFQELAKWINQYLRNEHLSVIEIGCNDGTLMDFLREGNHSVVGVDPAKNIAALALEKGHKVFCDYFSESFVQENNLTNLFDVVISTNSFAHVSNIGDLVEGISLALKEKGRFIVEVQSWPQLVKSRAFDFVYHEHKYYYDLFSIQNVCQRANLELEYAQLIESHGGSYRLVFVKSKATKFVPHKLIEEEFLSDYAIGNAFVEYEMKVLHTVNKLEKMSADGYKIIGFGASGRGNMLASRFRFNSFIKKVFDESPERIGRELGLTGIQVFDFGKLEPEDYDACLIFSWNHKEQIVSKWPHKGKKLILPLPEYEEIIS